MLPWSRHARPAALISKNASLSLDLLRGLAALTVFLHHCNLLGLDGGVFSWLRKDVGHSAVVIFFVLSGYVISATLPRNGSALDYGIRRVSRIQSVAIPAVLLTWTLGLAASHLALPGADDNYQLNKPWIYVPLALTFSGDLWGFAEPAFSNVPYWSLNYEVWYYVAFGIAVYTDGIRRWIGLLLVMTIMGPKLRLLFPISLGGVAVSSLQRSVPLSRCPARIMVVGAIGVFLILKFLHWEDSINELLALIVDGGVIRGLRFSQWFLGDYGVAILSMALVYALGSSEFRLPDAWNAPIVAFTNVSFSLYLVHYPLLIFFGGLLPDQRAVATLLSLGVAIGFGIVFEPRKTLVRRMLTALVTRRVV